MRTKALLLLPILCAAAALVFAADRRVFSSLSPDGQSLLLRWLHQDCAVETHELVAQIISAGPGLEESFWEAYDLGPTLEDREALQSTLGDRWMLRHRWLEVYARKAIDPEIAQELLSESEEQFRLAEDVKQIQRWRDAAISGLGLVCTDQSLVRLREIAKDPENPSSTAARVALETSDGCSARDKKQPHRKNR